MQVVRAKRFGGPGRATGCCHRRRPGSRWAGRQRFWLSASRHAGAVGSQRGSGLGIGAGNRSWESEGNGPAA